MEAVQRLRDGLKNVRGMDEQEERVWDDILKVARTEEAHKKKGKNS